jgi:nucleotide-binding universal stress UspA family protein
VLVQIEASDDDAAVLGGSLAQVVELDVELVAQDVRSVDVQADARRTVPAEQPTEQAHTGSGGRVGLATFGPGAAESYRPTNTSFPCDLEQAGVYDRVLHPTDASDPADAAAEDAFELAKRYDAPLHVLYVVDLTVGHATDAYAGQVVEELETTGRDHVESVAERARRAGLDVTTEVTEGRPATTIAETTEPGDVVVMGTHGRSGLDRYLVGSTTETVVRSVDVPVLTVPLSDDETSGSA